MNNETPTKFTTNMGTVCFQASRPAQTFPDKSGQAVSVNRRLLRDPFRNIHTTFTAAKGDNIEY